MEAVFFQSQQRSAETGMVSYRSLSVATSAPAFGDWFLIQGRNCFTSAVLVGRSFNKDEKARVTSLNSFQRGAWCLVLYEGYDQGRIFFIDLLWNAITIILL